MKTKGSTVSPVMRTLCSYIASTPRRKLPKKVAQAAKLEIVDTFAAMISGSRLIPGQQAIGFVKTLGGRKEASVIGSRVVTTVLDAAMANGMCAHADETDSGHSPTLSHISASAVPVALALAERDGLPGAALLQALVAGFDLGTRVLLAFGSARLLNVGHHAPAIGQLYGSTGAACCMLKLDARQVRHALAYTVQQTSGMCTMFRDSEHVEKSYAMGGMPAQNGLRAALMAAHGFTGVEDAFSGAQDFFSTLAREWQPDREALVRGLGRDFEILRSSIKRWPVGGPIQGPLNVLREMIAKHDLHASDVEAIRARVPLAEASIVDNRDMPEICLQQMLAILLTDGNVSFASAHDFARMRDKNLVALRKKITVVGDAMFDRHPRAWCCVLEVTLKDGRVLSGKTLASKGSYLNPLTPAEENEKALDLMGPVLGLAKSRKLLEVLWDIDVLPDVRMLRQFASV